MKYEAPKYEASAFKTADVLTASLNKYEVEQNNDGSGNVLINAVDLFR